MATLDVFRSTVGAAALGFARRALDETVERAATRKLFGAPLGDLQMTQAAIADSATRGRRLRAAGLSRRLDQGSAAPRASPARPRWPRCSRPRRRSASIDRAVQIHGGLGVTKGVKVEELYREIRALRIYEGATEVQKIVIARELLKERIRAAGNRAEDGYGDRTATDGPGRSDSHDSVGASSTPSRATTCRRARNGRTSCSTCRSCNIPSA